MTKKEQLARDIKETRKQIEEIIKQKEIEKQKVIAQENKQ